MKKYNIFIMACIFAGIFGISTHAKTYYGLSSASDMIIEASLPDGSAGVDDYDGGIRLYFGCDRTQGRVYAKTPVFEFDSNDGLLSLRTVFSYSCAEPTVHNKLTLYENETLNLCELIDVCNNSINVFRSAVISDKLEAGKEYTVELAVNVHSKDAYAYLDGELLFSGNLGSKWKNFDYSRLTVQAQNYTTSKTLSLDSEMKIKELEITGSKGDTYTEPYNGQRYINADTLDGVKVDFGGIMTAESYGGIRMYEDETEISVLTRRKGGIFTLKPENGFGYDKLYSLTLPAVYDLSGVKVHESSDISFSTAPQDFIRPSITLSGDEKVYEGQRAKITVLPVQGNIENVDIYVDGTLAHTFSGKKNEYVYELVRSAGVYTISARACDDNGAFTEYAELDVTVFENTPPQISVSVEDGKSYSASELNAVYFNVYDDIGVKGLEVYADSALIFESTDSELTLDLTGLSPGVRTLRAVAYDIAGVSSERAVSIIVTGAETEETVFFNDFEDYESTGGVIPENMNGAAAGDGKYTSYKYDEDHGTVLRMSTEGKKVNNIPATGTWLKIPTSGTANYFEADFDILFENEVKSYSLMLKDIFSSNLTQDLTFGADSVTLRTTGGNFSYPCSKDFWHHITIKADMDSKLWSVYYDGEAISENTPITNKNITCGDLRLIMNAGEGEAASVLIDNVKVIYREKETAVTAVGFDSNVGMTEISPDASVIDVYLNSQVDEATVNTQNISIDGGAKISGISYRSSDRKISIKLKNPLRSMTDYNIMLGKGLLLTNGRSIGRELNASFKTGLRELDVYDVERVNTSNGAYISCKIINEGAAKDIYTVFSVYDGMKLEYEYVQQVNVQNGVHQYITENSDAKGGKRIVFSVWTSLTQPDSVINKVYEFQ